MSIKPLWDIKFDEPSDPRAQIPIVYVRCGFGPLIGWANVGTHTCPACGGDGEIIATGKDGTEFDVTCPKCHGEGSSEGSKPVISPHNVAVWADVNGNIVQPAIGYDGYPTSAWLMEYAQRAAA